MAGAKLLGRLIACDHANARCDALPRAAPGDATRKGNRVYQTTGDKPTPLDEAPAGRGSMPW
jgi:hypothetical protein